MAFLDELFTQRLGNIRTHFEGREPGDRKGVRNRL